TDRLAAEGKTALLMVWDNASWHGSQAVRGWLKAYNRRVKRDGGCRIVVCPLPIKSPWLNRIEPKWVHGKRAMAAPDRKLNVDELKHRICAYDDCESCTTRRAGGLMKAPRGGRQNNARKGPEGPTTPYERASRPSRSL